MTIYTPPAPAAFVMPPSQKMEFTGDDCQRARNGEDSSARRPRGLLELAKTKYVQVIGRLSGKEPSPSLSDMPGSLAMRKQTNETTYLVHGTGGTKGVFESLAIGRRQAALMRHKVTHLEPRIIGMSAKDRAIGKKGFFANAFHKKNIFKDTSPCAQVIAQQITQYNFEYLTKNRDRSGTSTPIQLDSVHLEGFSRGCASVLEAAMILKKDHNCEVATLTLQHPIRSGRHATRQYLRNINPIGALLSKAINRNRWSLEHLMQTYTPKALTSGKAVFDHTKLRMFMSENDAFVSKEDFASMKSSLGGLFVNSTIESSKEGHCKDSMDDTISIIGGNLSSDEANQNTLAPSENDWPLKEGEKRHIYKSK